MTQNFAISGQLPDTIILPVETLNREFDAKLHLGLRAVARGWNVIIGGRTVLHSSLPHLPRSVYLSKGIRTGNRRIRFLRIATDVREDNDACTDF